MNSHSECSCGRSTHLSPTPSPKELKSIVEYLKKHYVGKVCVRKGPTRFGDWSHTDTPIFIHAVSENGEISYSFVRYKDRVGQPRGLVTLDSSFADREWITLRGVIRGGKSQLNMFKGMQIGRICPNKQFGSTSFMWSEKYSYLLVSASPHHILLQDERGIFWLLDKSFTDPAEWSITPPERCIPKEIHQNEAKSKKKSLVQQFLAQQF